MKCTKPLPEPGDCPKCGMSLQEHRYIYTCSMHPGVTSRKKGDSCWSCGMELVRTPSPSGKKAGDGKKRGMEHHGD